MRRPGLVVACVALLASGLLAGVPARTLAGGATYYLPVPAGMNIYVTQGNNTGDHIPTYESQDAFDFALVGNPGPEFPVAAARSGTVLAARFDSTVNCPGTMSCWGDWTQANYVLIDHGDKTSALYVHLAKGPATVKVGDAVTQGQVIGTAGNTGFSTANHLHFQVEQTPTPSSKAGWWWSQSVQIAFSDPTVLARFPGGVPTASNTPFVSGNVEQPQAPTLSGTWVVPKDGAKLTTSALTFSAKPTVTPTTLAVTKVAFSIKWGSTTKAACSATKAGSGGVWSCNVDLWKLGAPIGQLTLSFDVTDSAGDVVKAPAGTRTVTFAAVPGVPTHVTATPTCEIGPPTTCPAKGVQLRVAWKAPAGPVSGYQVFWTKGSWDFCKGVWTFAKTSALVAKNGGATSLTVILPWTAAFNGGRYSVVAVNAAGSSGPGLAAPFIVFDVGVCG
jgi:hypothetical protein